MKTGGKIQEPGNKTDVETGVHRTENREQRTGNREQRTENREQRTESGEFSRKNLLFQNLGVVDTPDEISPFKNNIFSTAVPYAPGTGILHSVTRMTNLWFVATCFSPVEEKLDRWALATFFNGPVM